MQSTTTGKPISPAHLGYLDGLRGLAALYVLVGHCMIWGGWVWRLMPDPKVAVDAFMVLSGYLMVHQWYAKREDGGRVSPGAAWRFYVRRFFRIAPLYWLVLIVTFVLGQRFLHGYEILRTANPAYWTGRNAYYIPQHFHYGWLNFLTHVTFVFGLIPQFSSSTFLPDWSIGLEMQFYAAFPLLLIGFKRLTPFVTALVGLLATKLYLRYGVHFPEASFLLMKLDVFLIGMLAAEAVRRFDSSRLYAAALALMAVLIDPKSEHVRVAGWLAILLFFMGASRSSHTLAFTQQVAGGIDRLLGNALAAFLADASYAVYLIHGLFISFVGGWLFSHPAFLAHGAQWRVCMLTVLTVIGVYPTAWLLHRFVELPGIQLGRQLIGRRNARTSTLTAAAHAYQPAA